MKKVWCLVVFLFISYSTAFSQGKDTSIFDFPIQMDEFVLKASREGWDVGEFIRRVKNDTTFYKAFKTLHLVPYTSTNDIRILGKNNQVTASLFSRTRQNVKNRCRTMDVLEEKTTGDFYNKKKEYNYYTAELYAYLFFTNKRICGENNIVAGTENVKGKGQMEKSKWQLKQLIFNPGSKVAGVPFAGNKAAIFEPEIAKMYDFKLMSVEYDGEDCYLFSAVPKPGHKGDVIYNELSTWFRRSDYAIVARDYALSYKTLVYDFDVKMKVRLRNVGGQLLPSRISYGGNWHVATKKRERAQFTTVINY
jgi:hypothetical protein